MPSAAGNSALAASLGSTPEAAAADGKPVASSSLDNPVKHLVYRPTSLQLLAHLGCVAEALPRDGILLVYLALHARKQGEPSSARSATRPITPASEAPKSPGGTGAARTESRQEDPFGEGPGAADSMASMVAVAKDAVAKGLYLGPSRQPDPGNSYLLVWRPAGGLHACVRAACVLFLQHMPLPPGHLCHLCRLCHPCHLCHLSHHTPSTCPPTA